MALYSKREFAELCNIQEKHISTYFKRGKIILTGSKIDSNNIVNKEFMKSKQTYTKKEKDGEEYKPTPEDEDLFGFSLFNTPKNEAQNKANTNKFSLESELKEEALRKLRVDTRIQELKEQKMLGDQIPTELALSAIVTQSQAMLTEFHNSVETMVVLFSKRKAMSSAEVAELRKNLVDCINTSVKKHSVSAKKEINSIIKEFQFKKSVGEKE